MVHVGTFHEILIFLGSFGFFVALYYAFKLSKETQNEKYWLSLAISALFLTLHEWIEIPWILHIVSDNAKAIMKHSTAFIGSILFAYAMYGLYTSMKKIKEKLE